MPPVQITPLSAAVLKIIDMISEGKNTPEKTHELNEDGIKLIALLRDPSFEAAFNSVFNLGLVQLLEALVQDLASQDSPSTAGDVEAPQLSPPPIPATACPNTPLNTKYYPKACYDSTTPLGRGSTCSSATRRRRVKKDYGTDDNPTFTICQWNSCGQVLQDFSRGALVSHLLTQHNIDLRSKNGIVVDCGWTGCRDNLLITSLAMHIMSIHLRSTVVKCPHCHKPFSREDGLNTHIKTQHPGMFDGPSSSKISQD